MAFAAAILPAVTLAATVVGTAASVAGSIASTNAQTRAAESEAQQRDANARVLEGNAVKAIHSSQDDVIIQDRQTLDLIGQQEAAQAGSGLSLNSGSHIMTRAAARALGRQDSQRVREAGELEARAYRTESQSQMTAAQGARDRISSIKTSGLFSALGAVANGVANIDSASTLVGGTKGTGLLR